MTPALPEYRTQVSVQENPLNPNLLMVVVSLTVWEGMSNDGRARVVNSIVEALRRHSAEAETRVVPALPPLKAKPPAHP